ncbi:MAG: arginine--tRNA ligase, partial [Nitrosotalea sp.]
MTLRLVYDEIRLGVNNACNALGYPKVEFDVSEASRPEFGDVSCNVGFLLAKALKKRPLDVSQSIADEYKKNLGEYVSEVSVHASGYLNFVANYSLLVPQVIHSSLRASYGSVDLGKNSKMVIEHT